MDTTTKVNIFRLHCIGFGHTAGTPLSTANFTVGTGRDQDIYPYAEVELMIEEIVSALQLGTELSACQKSVVSQLKAYGVLTAFVEIAK